MSNIYKYLAILLTGIIIGIIFMLKKVKPVINAGTYIDNMEQKVNKLKQRGHENTQTTEGRITIPGHGEDKAISKKEIRKSKREARREKRSR